MKKFISILAVIIVTVILCGANMGKPKPVMTEYIVSSGDTLQQIAVKFKPENMGVNRYKDILYRNNDGLTANIYPGDVIRVVTYE